MKALYTAVATATEGREGGHTKTDDGKVEFDLSLPSSMGGSGGAGTNPEQLFAAGYAACFANAIKSSAILEQRPQDAAGVSVTAEVDIGVIGKRQLGLAVRLHARVPSLPQEQAEELVEKAHNRCPYSNATRGNIDVAIEVEGAA